jgi:hypothetical protein
LKQLKRQLFEKNPGLRSQYMACSFGKLKFELRGALDVKLNMKAKEFSSGAALLNRAMHKAQVIEGVDNLGALADHIMFVLPPRPGGWIAVAAVNHWRSNFNSHWASSLSAGMHEIGHNLGLLHSGEGDSAYGDETVSA